MTKQENEKIKKAQRDNEERINILLKIENENK